MTVEPASGVADDRDMAIAGCHIAKRFGHVRALIDATIEVHPGEVVALFGDNGAGKSTLLKILLGVVRPDEGEIVIAGRRVHLSSPLDARRSGVDSVYQDLALAPDLSVIDNMYLGHEELYSGPRRWGGLLNRRNMADRAAAVLSELAITLPSLRAPVSELSGGQRQAVAVARAVMWAKTALLMDEPTAALGARQSEIVSRLMRTVAERGLGVLVVSHDIPRILKVADKAVILNRGRTALVRPAAELTVPDVVAAMVGHVEDAA
jgi:simple sugar transport system ATP-binding protein